MTAWELVERMRRKQQAELLTFKRELLDELIDMLTPSEVDKFGRIFHATKAKSIGAEDLKNAIRICEATIEKHRERVLDVIVEKLDE